MANFVVKAPPPPAGDEPLRFDEKTMWRGSQVCAGDRP